MRHLARVFCIVLALVAARAAVAQEKLVAVVFDTSTSMEPRIELPSFGVQLLTATLDGRSGKDRLYSINFTDYMNDCFQNDPLAATISQIPGPCDTSRHITPFDITDERSHANAVRTLREQYTAKAGATPFAPLEIMLDRLAQDVAPGEEIVLIVVVDGEYSEGFLQRAHHAAIVRDLPRPYSGQWRAHIGEVYVHRQHGKPRIHRARTGGAGYLAVRVQRRCVRWRMARHRPRGPVGRDDRDHCRSVRHRPCGAIRFYFLFRQYNFGEQPVVDFAGGGHIDGPRGRAIASAAIGYISGRSVVGTQPDHRNAARGFRIWRSAFGWCGQTLVVRQPPFLRAHMT